jgi:hypothetical protein
MIAFVSFVVSATAAGAVDATKLMRDSDKRHRVPGEHVIASMVLQASAGEQERRDYEAYYAQDDASGDKLLLRFKGPAEIKDTALLTIDEPRTKDTEQWLYLPGFRKTRRIGTAELGDRFVASDFFFEDLKRRYVDDYAHVLLREETLDGQPCWVIESKPTAAKAIKESPYAMTHFWLRKDNLMLVKCRFFDKRMRPLKELVATELVAVKGGAWRANRVEMTDVVRKHRTIVMVSKRDVSDALPGDMFSRHALGGG